MSVWLPISPEPQRFRIKGFLGFPTHTFPLNLPACLLSHWWYKCIHIHTHTYTRIHPLWLGWMGELVLSSWAKRHREVRRHQWSSNSPRELALHHRDVRDLPPRKTQKQDRDYSVLPSSDYHYELRRMKGRLKGFFLPITAWGRFRFNLLPHFCLIL